MKDDLVVGLDIGTTKICALVARLKAEGVLEILGVGRSSSRGVNKGVVTDIEETSQAVKEAVTSAELDAGLKVTRVWVSIAGDHILGQDNRGLVKITGEDQIVAAKDVEQVMKEASQLVLPPDREIIHVLAQRFLIDGQDLVKQPIGMKGTHLGVGVHVVTASSAWRGNIENCVKRAGYESEGVVLQSLASAMATVLPQEEDLGVVLVDIGGGTTDLAIFLREGLRFTRVIAVGGSHVTNDIAVGLHTTREKAEEIKLKYGTLSSARFRGKEKIRVERITGRGSYTIERKDLVRIIDPRMQEIFELVEKYSQFDELHKPVTYIRNGLGHWYTCLLYPGMEPTNNLGEQAIREHVIMNKIIGAFRSINGAKNYQYIASMFATWGLQGKNIFEELEALIRKELCLS